MRRLLGIVCAVALVFLLGCQLSQTGAPGTQLTSDDQARAEQEAGELREIRQLLEQTGMTVSTLAEDIQAQAELQRLEAGPPAIVRDLWPAQRVVGAALQAAQLKKAPETLKLLSRLRGLARALYSDLPATQIITHTERALLNLQLTEPNLDNAAAELTAAYNVASDPKLPKLRPSGVDALLQTNAKAQVTAGRAEAAIQVLGSVLDKCADHWSLQMLDRVLAGVDAAASAVDREAWPVVEAELMEVNRELTELAEQVHLQSYSPGPVAVTAEQPAEATQPTEAGQPAPGAAGEQPAATPEQGAGVPAPATEGVQPGAQPATETEAAPQPAPGAAAEPPPSPQ